MFWDRLKTQAELFKLIRNTIRHKPDDTDTFADLLEKRTEQYATNVFLYFEQHQFTYIEFNARANRVAHWAVQTGLRQGDCVALLMENRPEYLWTWAGLAKLGVVTALINTHLTGETLAHALEVCAAKHWIVGAECLEQLASALEVAPQCMPSSASEISSGAIAEDAPDAQRLLKAKLWIMPDGATPPTHFTPFAKAQNFHKVLEGMATKNPSAQLRNNLRKGDDLFYIFTSGTTGMPKPSHFSQMRFLSQGDAMKAITHYTPKDVIYCALPLYHGAGGALVPSLALQCGCAIALRRKFSAREFWNDCRRYNVTGFQYIGEFCRYLLHQPPRTDDRNHHVRIMLGAGLGPEIWREFQERFGIARIIESYGSTEANTSVINLDGKIGSIGRIPFKALHNGRLIRYDFASSTNPRNANGFCIECAAGEIGEFIGRIPTNSRVGAGRFEGYTSREETEKKILRNVFKTGDAWFRSGDLLRRDADGFLYFIDRIGDTFRWKSENVSTQQVAEILSPFAGVAIANVYGVAIPGHDGRAGMAALTLQSHIDPHTFDGKSFYAHCSTKLPHYAIPVFVRLQNEASLTGTFKLRKVELQNEGFDLTRVKDPLYVRDDRLQAFVPLTPDRVEHLIQERF